MSHNTETEYEQLLQNRDERSGVMEARSETITPELQKLLALEEQLKQTAQNISPSPALLQRIIDNSVTPLEAERYLEQAPHKAFTVRQMVKNLLIISSLAAACIVASVVYIQSTPKMALVEEANNLHINALPPEELAPITTDESIDTILSALEMWDATEKDTVVTADTTTLTQDIATEDQTINDIDQETYLYAQDL